MRKLSHPIGERKLFCIGRFWILFCLISLRVPTQSEAQDHFQQALTPRSWSFPRDHGRHDGFKLEWWYFTGNMKDSAGRQFGYQLTFFRNALAAISTTRPSPWQMSDIYFAHAAVSDMADKHFEFKDRLERPRAGLADSSDKGLNVSLLDWSAKMGDGKIHLKSQEKNLAIELDLADGRGPILEGPGGVNVKGHEPGQASYYYSMTRLKTTGKLMIDGRTFQVSGNSWMDHEFSSDALSKNQVGWDWMGLQLNDETDLMIYRMRNFTGASDYISGTLITADGKPHYLSGHDLKISNANPWTSPISGASYPQVWNLEVAGQPPITVQSDMPAQELITTASTKVTYFEGSATAKNARGIEIGKGYLEMTGYAKDK